MLEHSRIIQECNGDYVVQHAYIFLIANKLLGTYNCTVLVDIFIAADFFLSIVCVLKTNSTQHSNSKPTLVEQHKGKKGGVTRVFVAVAHLSH
jgi:hypothetical protein